MASDGEYRTRSQRTDRSFADDHQIVREGLARLIDREKDLKIVAEADNGRDAVRLAKKIQPDLIVLDLKMPVMDGSAAATTILRDNPGARVLILTSFTTNAEVKAHLAIAFDRLGAASRTEAASLALSIGMI